jgi:hypothetical protein
VGHWHVKYERVPKTVPWTFPSLIRITSTQGRETSGIAQPIDGGHRIGLSFKKTLRFQTSDLVQETVPVGPALVGVCEVPEGWPGHSIQVPEEMIKEQFGLGFHEERVVPSRT